jgi:hypothetical protein
VPGGCGGVVWVPAYGSVTDWGATGGGARPGLFVGASPGHTAGVGCGVRRPERRKARAATRGCPYQGLRYVRLRWARGELLALRGACHRRPREPGPPLAFEQSHRATEANSKQQENSRRSSAPFRSTPRLCVR